MWSVLGGDTWCNQVTSLHEENPPTFRLRYKNFFSFFQWLITAWIIVYGALWLRLKWRFWSLCNIMIFTVSGSRKKIYSCIYILINLQSSQWYKFIVSSKKLKLQCSMIEYWFSSPASVPIWVYTLWVLVLCCAFYVLFWLDFWSFSPLCRIGCCSAPT